jgi:thiol-disulfide isomerase/thioredoxin
MPKFILCALLLSFAPLLHADVDQTKVNPNKPLDLKYNAVDGTVVDLAKMRGKVVLVDFWATWCPPCRGEVPNVVAAYKKYHDQGFEVVGVSLDQNKDALLAFTKENGMVWPQYFDGKGWNNEISKGFGIDSIPAMWLVGKDGKVITRNAREDLAGQVEKALKAP